MLPIYYSSTEPNAPTLNNAAGSLIAVLDAVLVNGFGLKSVGAITVAGGVATVTCTGHQFVGGIGRKVAIAGATPGALNGNQDVTVVDANTFTFATAAAAGTATGAITAKRPGLGWTKPFTGTNTAIYQRSDSAATGMLLRVVDTTVTPATTTYARAFGVEGASDIGAYSGQFPTQAQLPDGVYMSKGLNTTAAKQWHLVGDGRTFHLLTDDGPYHYASYGGLHYFTFGDVDSWRSGGDPYGCVIAGGSSTNGESTCILSDIPASVSGMYVARQNNLIGASVKASHWGRGVIAPGSGYLSGGVYPSPVDNGMALERTVLIREDSSAGFAYPFRGRARGLAHPMAALNSTDAIASSFHGALMSGWLGTQDTFLSFVLLHQSTRAFLFFNLTSEW